MSTGMQCIIYKEHCRFLVLPSKYRNLLNITRFRLSVGAKDLSYSAHYAYCTLPIMPTDMYSAHCAYCTLPIMPILYSAHYASSTLPIRPMPTLLCPLCLLYSAHYAYCALPIMPTVLCSPLCLLMISNLKASAKLENVQISGECVLLDPEKADGCHVYHFHLCSRVQGGRSKSAAVRVEA